MCKTFPEFWNDNFFQIIRFRVQTSDNETFIILKVHDLGKFKLGMGRDEVYFPDEQGSTLSNGERIRVMKV